MTQPMNHMAWYMLTLSKHLVPPLDVVVVICARRTDVLFYVFVIYVSLFCVGVCTMTITCLYDILYYN